jgi:hypothetical protein
MTESIPKPARGDVVEWTDGERAKVGERFRVEDLPSCCGRQAVFGWSEADDWTFRI